MSFSILSVANIAEIKLRRGNTTTNMLCIMLGPNYPLADGVTFYVWNDASTDTPDDDEFIVGASDAGVGRWVKVDSADVAQIHIQPDWNESLSTSLAFIKNKPSIGTQVQSDWTEGNPLNLGYIKDKPALFDGSWGSLTDKPMFSTVSISGAYSDLLGKPTLFSGSFTDLTNKPTLGKVVVGTTVKSDSFPIFKSGTVGTGTVVFNLTDDGLSTGNSLFVNEVFTDSIQVIVNDALASYQMSWAFSNSNKTLTVTANKLSTANILTGVLGQAQANGAVVKLTIWGR